MLTVLKRILGFLMIASGVIILFAMITVVAGGVIMALKALAFAILFVALLLVLWGVGAHLLRD